MLPKRRRLTRHNFPSRSRTGSVFHTKHLTLRVTPSSVSGFRVSVVVSKKTARRAVDRNLVKRRVYDSVARSPESPSASYVFFAKAGASVIPFRELNEEVGELLRAARAAIVKPSRLV
ncbi:MAG TPA: ribonuclease P protein component [Candidatus Paceibacterota bacterium]|nr:ribonuclease P protein component [Candidatus Paceibacterota bacterium]